MKWKILSGLPGYGEVLQFAHKGEQTFSEGLVVIIDNVDGNSWVGNFQPYTRNGLFFSGVFNTTDKENLWVVSSGRVYYVNTRSPEKFSILNLDPTTDVRMISETSTYIFVNATNMHAYRDLENIWNTVRISLDDLEVVSMNKRFIEVRAWHPWNRNTEHPILRVDLATGDLLDEIDIVF